jgi:hypothetical protein
MSMVPIPGEKNLFYDSATKTVYERQENGDFNAVSISGAALVYGLARNAIKRVPADGAYTATETFGLIVSKAPTSDDTAITPVAGSAITSIKAATFAVGQTVPIHASSVTVGTGGEFLLFIP